MKRLAHHFRARPRLSSAIVVGLAAAWLLPGTHGPVTRALFGWNVGVWLNLVLVAEMMLRADHGRLRRIAVAQAEGTVTVLVIVVGAALASLAGTVVELSAAKLPGAAHALPHLAFALATVLGSWLVVPTMFTLAYASLYYRPARGGGLQFPGGGEAFHPDYGDFLYFAFTIAVAAQTSDVAVTTPHMRRLVMLQALLSFAFNTAILAFTVNIAASMF